MSLRSDNGDHPRPPTHESSCASAVWLRSYLPQQPSETAFQPRSGSLLRRTAAYSSSSTPFLFSTGCYYNRRNFFICQEWISSTAYLRLLKYGSAKTGFLCFLCELPEMADIMKHQSCNPARRACITVCPVDNPAVRVLRNINTELYQK